MIASIFSNDKPTRRSIPTVARRHSWWLGMLCVVLVALVSASVASAHGTQGGGLFVSGVTAITPSIHGLTAVVLGSDDTIEMENRSGRTVIVGGYEGEPYLMFSSRGVAVNVHSPARYLNKDRFGRATLPPVADAKLPPQWETVTLGSRWSWYDHRIHWMTTVLPEVANRDPTRTHLVFRWRIPIAIFGGASAEIHGRLDYVPPGDGSKRGLIIGIALPSGVVALAGVGTLLIVKRRRRLEAAK